MTASVDYTRERFADLTQVMKKYQTQVEIDWRYFVDLNLLGDYVEAFEAETIYEKVQKWVQEPVEHKLSDFDFHHEYTLGIRNFLFPHYKSPTIPFVSIIDFLRDPMYWATPGSSNGLRLRDNNGKLARKGKWATALASDILTMVNTFWDPSPQSNLAVPKRELGKCRMIIAGDLSNYLRMSYVARWLEHVLRDHPRTTLFKNKHQIWQMWQDMIDNTGAKQKVATKHFGPNSEVNVPLDESEFDHMIDEQMNIIGYTQIRAFIETHWDWPDKDKVLEAWDITTKSCTTDKGYIEVLFPNARKRKVYIKKGLPSGLRFTALFGTMSNDAKVTMFRKIVARRAFPVFYDLFDPVINSDSQGDDLRSRQKSVQHAEAFVNCYKETGFSVHPRKFFVSNNADEFLRKLALDGKVLTGYPARGVANMIFRNPIRAKPHDLEYRFRERIANWFMLARRIQTPLYQIEHHMTRDLTGMTGMSKAVISDVLHAPFAYGGAGMLPLRNKRVEYMPAKFKEVALSNIAPIITNITHEIQEQKILQQQYLRGVDWGKKIIDTPASIRVFDEAAIPDVSNLASIQHPISTERSLAPRSRDDITPSLVHAYRELTLRARRQNIFDSAAKWMDSESQSMLLHLLPRASMRLIKDWIRDDLASITPELPNASSLIVSPVFNSFSTILINRVLSSNRVSYSRMQRAAISAELLTREYVDSYPSRYLD